MTSALVLSVDGAWYGRHEEKWAVLPEYPRLKPQSSILSDFNNAPSGLMTVDSRPGFAAAVVEKHLRQEGLVDGEAHVLAHRIIAAAQASRVLYTAVPVSTWQATFAWLNHQPSLGLLFSIDGAMLALAQRHDAVLCRVGRQFRFMVSHAATLIYLSITAFSDDPDDLETALLSLADQVRAQWPLRDASMAVYWCDVLASDQSDGAHLHTILRQRLEVEVTLAPVARFDCGAGPLRSAADALLQALSWRAAENSWFDRIAAASSRFMLPIAVVTALIGVSLLGVAGFWASEAMHMQAHEKLLRDEVVRIEQRNVGMDATPAVLLAPHAESLAFLDVLDGAVASPDLLGFLDDLRKAAGQSVRVMRVRLITKDGGFRIEGVPVIGVGAEHALSGFLAALNAAGYQVHAEDPGIQAQQPGIFSYSLRRIGKVMAEKS